MYVRVIEAPTPLVPRPNRRGGIGLTSKLAPKIKIGVNHVYPDQEELPYSVT
jgi:hypothetical protein